MLLVFILFIIIFVIASIKLKIIIQIKDNKLNLIMKFYIFGKLLVGKINLYKNKNKNQNKKHKNKKKKITKKELRKLVYIVIKNAKTNLELFNLQIDICTTDVILTSYSVALISNIITFILKKSKIRINYQNCSYQIIPIYSDKKILNIELDSIISANLVHIISIIYGNIKEWRCKKNGRKTSDRRAYGNCYE